MVRLPGEGDPVSVMQALNLSGVMLSHCPYGPCSSSGRCSELGVVGRWAWHRAGSRPGAHHPPRGASSELCHPHQEGSLQALGGGPMGPGSPVGGDIRLTGPPSGMLSCPSTGTGEEWFSHARLQT